MAAHKRAVRATTGSRKDQVASAYRQAADQTAKEHAEAVVVEIALPDATLKRGGIGAILPTNNGAQQTNIDTSSVGSLDVAENTTSVITLQAPGQTLYGLVLTGVNTGGCGAAGDLLVPYLYGNAAQGNALWPKSKVPTTLSGNFLECNYRPEGDYHHSITIVSGTLQVAPTPVTFSGVLWFPCDDGTWANFNASSTAIMLIGTAIGLRTVKQNIVSTTNPQWNSDYLYVFCITPSHGEDVMNLALANRYRYVTRSSNLRLQTTNSVLQSQLVYKALAVNPQDIGSTDIVTSATFAPGGVFSSNAFQAQMYDETDLEQICTQVTSDVINPAIDDKAGMNLKACMIGIVDTFPEVNDAGVAGSLDPVGYGTNANGTLGNGRASWSSAIGLTYLFMSIPASASATSFQYESRARVTALVPATSGLMKRNSVYHASFPRQVQALAQLPVAATAHSFWKNISEAVGGIVDGAKSVGNQLFSGAKKVGNAAVDYIGAAATDELLAILAGIVL